MIKDCPNLRQTWILYLLQPPQTHTTHYTTNKCQYSTLPYPPQTNWCFPLILFNFYFYGTFVFCCNSISVCGCRTMCYIDLRNAKYLVKKLIIIIIRGLLPYWWISWIPWVFLTSHSEKTIWHRELVHTYSGVKWCSRISVRPKLTLEQLQILAQ